MDQVVIDKGTRKMEEKLPEVQLKNKVVKLCLENLS